MNPMRNLMLAILMCMTSLATGAATSDLDLPGMSVDRADNTDSIDENLQLPEIGDPSGNLLTPRMERILGRAFMRNVRARMHVIDNPVWSDYIGALGNRLAAHSDARGGSFHFFLIDDPVINAFAGPAGYIGVYRGLIMTTRSENELASVIAHEIAHVTQKHLYRAVDAARNMSIPNAAMLIGAIILGAAGSPEAGAAAMVGSQAASAQQQLNFTRRNENEADHIGIKILAASGYDPRDMAVFFARMGKATRLYRSGHMPEFLQTHPVSATRVADAQARAEKYPYIQPKEDVRYDLLKAWFKSRDFEDPADTIKHFQNALDEGRYHSKAAMQYGLSLGYISDRQYTKAINILKKLNKQFPQQMVYTIALAEAEMNDDKQIKALERLENEWLLHPGNHAITMTYASALLHVNLPDRAYQLLREHLKDRPESASVYRLLSQAAGQSDRITESHRYLAEYYYQSGAPELAARQLEIALRDKDVPYYQGEQMEARLAQFKQEMSDIENRL
ncbi:MAG: M48 family metalloprotease [gamma proteobacterium symbiont of Bathyaustriella thionipta]|nr:M48 family metalloprotease [gamma proteobacterium symbiont of Bathyaustriella thionipta]